MLFISLIKRHLAIQMPLLTLFVVYKSVLIEIMRNYLLIVFGKILLYTNSFCNKIITKWIVENQTRTLLIEVV